MRKNSDAINRIGTKEGDLGFFSFLIHTFLPTKKYAKSRFNIRLLFSRRGLNDFNGVGRDTQWGCGRFTGRRTRVLWELRNYDRAGIG